MAGNYVGRLQELCIFLLGDFFNRNNRVVDTTNSAQSKLQPAEPAGKLNLGCRGYPQLPGSGWFSSTAAIEKLSFREQEFSCSALQQDLCILLLPYHREVPADWLILVPKSWVKFFLVLFQVCQDSH